MDATRWANVPANEELSWRSRTRDEPKEESTPAEKDEEDIVVDGGGEDDVGDGSIGGGGGGSTGGGSERSDVWKPGGGEYFVWENFLRGTQKALSYAIF